MTNTPNTNDKACNYCDRRDCPALNVDPDVVRTRLPAVLATITNRLDSAEATPIVEYIEALAGALHAAVICRSNLREDIEVVHESLADAVNAGEVGPPMCAWCTSTFTTYGAIRDHLLSCPKHPVVIVANRRLAALKALIEVLDDVLDEDVDAALIEQVNEALQPAKMPDATAG